MNEYVKAMIEEISENDVLMNSTDECEVVCTYMYGYCDESDGWGTTYCPEWGTSSTDDDDDDNDDDGDDE